MPIGNAWAVADVGCNVAALAAAPAYQAASGMTGAWESAAGLAVPAVQALLVGLYAAGVPAPEVGFELMGSDGCVAADCELAWPSKRIAVLLIPDDAPAFIAAGWTVCRADDATLLDTLTGLLTQV
jgi:DEAD/DEAH box helicase domain-containing protein